MAYLKSLTLRFGSTSPNAYYMAISEIDTANIGLEKNSFVLCKDGRYGRLASRGNKKIEKVRERERETLKLVGVLGWNSSHIGDICNHSTELSELNLAVNFTATPEFFLEMMRNANKLKLLTLVPFIREFVKICIEVNTFMAMAKIVQSRCDKSHLKIQLESGTQTLNNGKFDQNTQNAILITYE